MIVDIRHSLDGAVQGCVLSDCETYRHAWWRIWDASLPLWHFGMLNPSKADADELDPTVSRQCERARRKGAGGIVVTNEADLRETDRLKAKKHPCPISPDNELWVAWLMLACDVHIAAYGPDAAEMGAGDTMRAAARETGTQLYALHITKSGQPGHPLYLAYDLPLLEFAA